MKDLKEILLAHPFFKGMEEMYVDFIAGCGKNEQHKEGAYLFKEGAPANYFYIIRKGKLALESICPGKGSIILETLNQDEVVGWSWLFEPYKWTYSGRVVQDCRVTALDGNCLRGKCENDPVLGYELFKRFSKIIISRLQESRLQIMDLYKA
jgi:CRP-like cAMP-binding protein